MSSKMATLLGLAAAASLVVGYVQWQARQRLAAENAQLRLALEPAQTPGSSLATEKTETDAAPAADKLELLRLRNEVRQLREGAKEFEKFRAEQAALKPENSRLGAAQAGAESTSTNVPGLLRKEEWRFAGYSSPETTVQSIFHSMAAGDYEGFVAALSPAGRERFVNNEVTKEKFAADAAKRADEIAGFRILGRDPSSTDEQVVLSLEVLEADGKSKQQPMTFVRDGQEWKMTENARKPNRGPRRARSQ